MNPTTITAGGTYTGPELIAYASRNPATLLFLENSSGGFSADAATRYDVVAVEQGFLQMQGGVNRAGTLVTLRLSY